MEINPDELPPMPHDRFPQAVAERRFVLVAVDQGFIADLITNGMEGREFRSNIEGLPKGAIVCDVFPDPVTACVMLRFVHPDLPSVYVGAAIMQLEGTVEILERPLHQKMDRYGKELILDLTECDSSLFTRNHIKQFFIALCDEIDMKRCDLHFWDDLDTPEDEKETEPHLKGTSAVQFIKTSNITIHTLDLLSAVYLNIFSCKDFDETVAAQFSADWFRGKIFNSSVGMRG